MLVKICCMQNEAEVHVASEAGATHVGLVGPMPSGVGPITDEAIAAIASSAPESVTTVLLTSRTRPSDIVDHVLTTGLWPRPGRRPRARTTFCWTPDGPPRTWRNWGGRGGSTTGR
jgi:hypothetical protein